MYTISREITGMDTKQELWKKQWKLTMCSNVTMFLFLMLIFNQHQIFLYKPFLSSCIILNSHLYKLDGNLVSSFTVSLLQLSRDYFLQNKQLSETAHNDWKIIVFGCCFAGAYAINVVETIRLSLWVKNQRLFHFKTKRWW